MGEIEKKCSIFLLALLLMVQIPVSARAQEIEINLGNTVVMTESSEISDMGETSDLVKESYKGASVKMSFSGKLTALYTPGRTTTYEYTVKNMPSNGKIIKVSSSKSKVAKILINDNKVWIRPQKAGKSTIKVTVRVGSKLTTFTSKLVVYEWTNPVANYKIGNKQLKKKFNNTYSYDYKLGDNKTLTFKVKAKSGWKITSFTYFDKNGNRTSYLNPAESLKVEKGSSVQINFRNLKTGVVENVIIWIN